MDALDEQIVSHLRRDARASFTGIAETVGTSEATVRARVRRLQREGVIRQFTVRVRGANIRAIVEVEVETNVLTSKVAEAIRALPGVEEVWELTGEYDVAGIVSVNSTDELNNVVDGIRRIGSARSTRTRVILNELI